jgi:hypothetical protein
MHSLTARKRRTLILAAVLAITFLVGTSLYLIAKPARDANRVVQSLRRVELGQTHIEELMRTIPGHWVTGLPKGSRSNYQLALTNKFLHNLRLAPLTGIVINIGTDAGTIDEIEVFWSIGEFGSTAQVQFFQVMGHTPECGRNICVHRLDQSDGRPSKIQAMVSPTATAAERNRLLDFNIGCLSKIGGCKDARELLSISDD